MDVATRTVRVAAVQLSARGVEDADEALEDSLDAIADAGASGAQLVVLPEATWPGYIVGLGWQQWWPELADQEQILDRYATAAATAGVVLVAGVVLHGGDGLVNAAVVWERDGTPVGSVHKRFLWDFDARWFVPGRSSPVLDTSVGRLGVMVCADGRMPELARLMAVEGAELLLDPTAWVTTGADPATWTNIQYEHMLRTRAEENGLWTVAANKVGLERDAVAYCGRSCVMDPSGTVVAEAASDRPGLVVAECELAPAHFPVRRRPELYTRLVQPTADLRVTDVIAEPLVPGRSAGRIAIDVLDRPLDERDGAFLQAAGVDLLVTPAPLTALAKSFGWVLQASGTDDAELFEDGEERARWQRTHGHDAPGDRIGPVVATPLGRLGVLLGADGIATEAGRSLMLDGADVIVWFPGLLDVARMARSRAAENRVHVALSAPPGGPRSALMDADGRVLAVAGEVPRMLLGQVVRSESRRKEMAPGTDVVAGRQPESYAALARPTTAPAP